MERNLLKYIWRHSRSKQIWIFIVVLAAMPVYFLMLQLPKLIVNGPIQAVGFETPEATQPFLSISLPFTQYFTDQQIMLFDGFQLQRPSMLVVLCISFLLAVALNGWFKLYINTYKGKLGESLLRRLRYELFDRVLRYPIGKIRQVKPSEISSVIKDEVEPLGEFFGDAFSAPVFLGAQALTGMTFLFLQNTMFGAITLGIVVFQAWIIPRLRRRLLELGRRRQRAARRLSGRIGEYVQGMDDVHLHGVTNRARANIWNILRGILATRFELYQRKFFVKFINNFLIQLLAFIFYLLGGYLVITGRMDLGALVASIAAYKDLPAPIKGIIDWDQQRLMNQIRYEQAVEDFAETEIVPYERQVATDQVLSNIQEGYKLSNITVVDSSDQPVIESFSANLSRHEAVAIVGGNDSGAEQVAEVLGRLLHARSGSITLDGNDLDNIAESQTGQRIGYADSNVFYAGGSIKATLAETLPFVGNAAPVIKNASSGADFSNYENDAMVSADVDMIYDVDDPVSNPSWPDDAFWPHLLSVMRSTRLYNDVLEFGLLRTLDSEGDETIKASLLEARREFADDKSIDELSGAVEFFDPEKYNHQLTIGENLIFGTPLDAQFNPENLPSNKTMLGVLKETDLMSQLFDAGREVAENNVELFGDLTEDSMLLQRTGGPSPEQIVAMKQMLDRTSGKTVTTAPANDVTTILALAFGYSETQSRFGVLDEALQTQLLNARKKLAETLGSQGNDSVAFLDPARFNPSLTIIDNILFGRIDARRTGARDRVLNAIKKILEERNISETIFRIGLSYDIGVAGRNLTTSQAQKLKVARALLKKPDMVILNRALSALDPVERKAIIHDILSLGSKDGKRQMGVICVPVDLGPWDDFDRVILMEGGRISIDGTPEQVAPRLEMSNA